MYYTNSKEEFAKCISEFFPELFSNLKNNAELLSWNAWLKCFFHFHVDQDYLSLVTCMMFCSLLGGDSVA